MDTLTPEETELLVKHERAKQKHRERQKRYIQNLKASNPNYSEERAKYMREYNAKTRGKIQKIEDKIGYLPKTIEIPVIEPEKVDLRTKRGRRAVMTNSIKPSFEDRKYELESKTIEGYIGKLNVLHKFFMNGKNIPGPIKSKIKSVMGSMETFEKLPEIEKEMPYLRDADGTIKAIRKKYYNDNSFKSYITPITVLTSHIRSLSEQYQKYTRVAKNTNEAVEEDRKKNISREEDKEKIIDLRDRKVILENLKKLTNLKDKLVYGLYTLMPPRRLETRLLQVTNEKNVKKLNDIDDNYVIMNGPMKFVWNQYKTYKEFGQQVYDVPKELQDIIRLYVEANNLKESNYLFHLQSDKRLPIAQSNFSKLIENVFYKVYDIPKISARFIRQSFASTLSNKSYAEREKLAIAMGHSLVQNLKYSKHLDAFVDD